MWCDTGELETLEFSFPAAIFVGKVTAASQHDALMGQPFTHEYWKFVRDMRTLSKPIGLAVREADSDVRNEIWASHEFQSLLPKHVCQSFLGCGLHQNQHTTEAVVSSTAEGGRVVTASSALAGLAGMGNNFIRVILSAEEY